MCQSTHDDESTGLQCSPGGRRDDHADQPDDQSSQADDRRGQTDDRRGQSERRVTFDRRSGWDRRRGPGRRRSDDRRAAEEGEMTPEQFEFLMAIQEYKKANKQPFPSFTEVLEILKALGYRKVAEPQPLAASPGDA